MKHLDLFSGIGGFALAARWAGMDTVGFCEIEEYPRKVLEKNFPGVPIHKDIRELNGSEYEGIDLITGGYPCQPFSTAGKRKGHEDDRHLWPEMLRIVTQARPTWIVAENVTGHITMGLDQVLSDLENEGYASRTIVIPACGVGAEHRRDRVWILANSGGRRLSGEGKGEVEQSRGAEAICTSKAMADTESGNVRRRDSFKVERQRKESGESGCTDGGSWALEPRVGRVVDGLPHRMDRIRGLGNAIIPQIAYRIMMAIGAEAH